MTAAARGRASLYRFFHAGDDETLALRGVSLDVDAGETGGGDRAVGVGQVDAAGCLAGLDEPDGGTVWIGGERLSRRPEAERARLRAERIGVLYQTANLFEHLDRRGQRALARGSPAAAAAERRDEVLERVGLADRADACPSELSGGELARAGLAVALANDPAVVLADEPTGRARRGDRRRASSTLLRARAAERRRGRGRQSQPARSPRPPTA